MYNDVNIIQTDVIPGCEAVKSGTQGVEECSPIVGTEYPATVTRLKAYGGLGDQFRAMALFMTNPSP